MRQAVEREFPEADDLAVYVIWLPVLGSDSRAAAVQAMNLVPNRQARHYWSGDKAAGKVFQKVVPQRGSLAWDAYLIYPAGETTEWPPKPLRWFGPRPDPTLLAGAIKQARGAP